MREFGSGKCGSVQGAGLHALQFEEKFLIYINFVT
jgi:hypothetical protein